MNRKERQQQRRLMRMMKSMHKSIEFSNNLIKVCNESITGSDIKEEKVLEIDYSPSRIQIALWEYIEEDYKKTIAAIEEVLPYMTDKANNGNDVKRYSEKELYGFGLQQIVWLRDLLNGEGNV